MRASRNGARGNVMPTAMRQLRLFPTSTVSRARPCARIRPTKATVRDPLWACSFYVLPHEAAEAERLFGHLLGVQG